MIDEIKKELKALNSPYNPNDIVLLNVNYMIECNIRQIDKLNTKIICYNLLKFAFEKGMLKKSPFEYNEDLNIWTIIRESSLTDLGKPIFDSLADKWLGYTDNESGNIDRKNNIKMLDKYYSKLTINGKKIQTSKETK